MKNGISLATQYQPTLKLKNMVFNLGKIMPERAFGGREVADW